MFMIFAVMFGLLVGMQMQAGDYVFAGIFTSIYLLILYFGAKRNAL